SLGALMIVLLALALAAGWPRSAEVHPALPFAGACGLVLFVTWKFLSPPTLRSLFPGSTSGGAFGSALARSMTRALASGLDLHFPPTWGLGLAAIGAFMALFGTFATWQATREPPAQPFRD